MTVSNNVNKTVQNGNGVSTSFPFTFQVSETDGSDIEIYITNTAGVVQLLSTNYLVTLNNINDLTAGGVVTYPYPTSGTKLASGEKITIMRTVGLTQELNLINTGPFMAETIETAIDKIVMSVQQIDEKVDRALLASVSDSATYTLPSAVAGKAIGWNAAGDGLTNYTYSGVDNTAAIERIAIDIKSDPYNAVGDGIADDTLAFSTALAAMDEGDVLYIPRGTYLIDINTIIITTNNITIRGQGILRNNGSDAGYFIRVQASGFTMEGITIDNNATLFNGTEPYKTGLTIETPLDSSNLTDITIRNCRITNWTLYAIGVTENSDDNTKKGRIDNIRIENCYITASVICIENFPKVISYNAFIINNYCEILGNDTVIAETTCIKPCEIYMHAVVTGNICIGGKTSGVALGLYNKYLDFSNNIIVSPGAAIGINHTGHSAYSLVPSALLMDYIKIHDNIFVSTASVGMIINGLYDFNHMLISNNYIEGNTYALYMQPLDAATENLKDVSFNNNKFVGKSKVFRSDDGTKHIENVKFNGDIFVEQVDIQYVKNASFINTTFENSTTFGIQLTGCEYISFKNSIFNNLATEGCVLSSGTNINFTECEFINCNTSNTGSTNCLNVVGTPTNIFVKDCLFENKTSVGYAVRAIYVAAGTNIFVNLGNIYIGMTNSSMVYFGVVVYANMNKASKTHYATNIPSTEYSTTAFAAYDRAIMVNPVEAGSGGSKYITVGWTCSVAGTPGTWLPERVLTGN